MEVFLKALNQLTTIVEFKDNVDMLSKILSNTDNLDANDIDDMIEWMDVFNEKMSIMKDRFIVRKLKEKMDGKDD